MLIRLKINRSTMKCKPTSSSRLPIPRSMSSSHKYAKCSFLPLLEFEQQAEESILRERLSSWSLQRLQQEGYCITDLHAFWLDAPGKNFGTARFVAGFALGPGITLPSEHRFEYVSAPLSQCFQCLQSTFCRLGTQVLVTHLDPLKEEPQRGSVLGCTDTQLRIAFQEKFDLDDGKPWRCAYRTSCGQKID